MNPLQDWQRLAAAARRAPDDRDTSAPLGFSTRVAALALAESRRPVSLLDQFSLRVSLRVFGAASALALVAAGASYPGIVGLFSGVAAAPPVLSSSAAPAAAIVPASPPTGEIPAGDTSPASPATGDDPVTELVNIVS
jgi:hypothetical protein